MKRIVAFHGGLGNQMFEYALYLKLNKIYPNVFANFYLLNRNREHNGFELDKVFKLSLPEIWYGDLIVRLIRKFNYLSVKNKFLRHLNKFIVKSFSLLGAKICLDENHGVYKPAVFNKENFIFWGTWHSPKYFDDFEQEIKNVFTFDTSKLNPKSAELEAKLNNLESVSLHIRRGDYLSNSAFSMICTPAYYREAIRILEERVKKNLHYIVFSDDIQWAKKNVSVQNVTYVDWNTGSDSWQDMYLMSRCQHNIIANSTFSWWGGWLNLNPSKIVVCPDKILNNSNPIDLYPADWIHIKSNIYNAE